MLFFFKINFFEKKKSFRNIRMYQQSFQIRTDVLSGLTWVQAVWKGYQQATLVGKQLRDICVFSTGSENGNCWCKLLNCNPLHTNG